MNFYGTGVFEKEKNTTILIDPINSRVEVSCRKTALPIKQKENQNDNKSIHRREGRYHRTSDL